MDELKLVAPTETHRVDAIKYKVEFSENGEVMHGSAGLDREISFEDWLCEMRDNADEKTVREGKVPSSTFFGVRKADGKIVGIIDIRHKLNDYLLNFGGHIGYRVRKSERRKGYAKEMLRLALLECKARHIERVLVTCDKENTASAGTILANGGILENEMWDGEDILQRYWVAI